MVDFAPHLVIPGIFQLLVRSAVRVMPSQWRKHRWVAGAGLWGSEKELRRCFDDTEVDKDRDVHWVAIEGAWAILGQLYIPAPPKEAGPATWRPFLAHIVAAAKDGDATKARAVMSRPEWRSLDDHSGFGEPSPAFIGDQPGTPKASTEKPRPEERIFTAGTVGEILAPIGDLTSLGIQQRAEPHIGKWIPVQSTIKDIEPFERSFRVTIGKNKFAPDVFLWFERDKWEPLLETMSRGKRIAAERKNR